MDEGFSLFKNNAYSNQLSKLEPANKGFKLVR